MDHIILNSNFTLTHAKRILSISFLSIFFSEFKFERPEKFFKTLYQTSQKIKNKQS
jgi:hypothetical protein